METLMSRTQYNLEKPTNYLKRKMFLDQDGPVTIQRFEEVKYPKIQKFEEIARGFFWVPEEISLVKDAQDFKNASEAVKHIFTSNLLRQTALDSLQGRGPSQIFTPVVSLPELEALVYNWTFFETNIHSRSYSHIIRNIYNVPKEVFNTIHNTKPIVDMASSVGRYYDNLHRLNCQKEIYESASVPFLEADHIKAIWLALNASYALEAFRFMVSFATSLAMVENKIFIGNGNIISLILQDELLHAEWTGWLINQVVKEDERFAKIREECEQEVYEIYMDVIAEEKAWAEYLFSKGVVIGLNSQILKDFVDYTAFSRLRDIGIKYLADHPKSSPIPWFNKHVNINKKQTALQENESTNYVIGVMSDIVELEKLPDL
ncbi:MAG: ribonucleotide-diphosphate reductase subunit beta [Proteobacteria bacterium]|nr:ribonucleotide-diphosphate reductase subunit beta [Pseudomonadota bacterium]NBP14122.1 ribonucleotide-diphosphate reductase subunit beta [bacterium]